MFSVRIFLMKFSRLHIIISGVVGIALVSIFFATQKTVIIDLEGKQITIKTHASTIKGALQSAKIDVGEKDMVFPSSESTIKNREIILVRRASQIFIEVNGQVYNLESANRFPASWLAAAGIPFSPDDQVLVFGKVQPIDIEVGYAPYYTVEVSPTIDLSLDQGGDHTTIRSNARTWGQALWDTGIYLHAADNLQPPPDTPTNNILQASLKQARPVEISMDGQIFSTLVAADTVGEALAEAGFSLQGFDYSEPFEDQPLPENGNIRVVRVREEVILEQNSTPFWVEYQPDNETEIDNTRVIEFGAYGLEVQQVRVRYEDGQEVSRVAKETWVVSEPKPRIEGYGTNIVVRTINTADGPIEYWRVLNLFATSYSPCNSAGEEGRCYPYTSGRLKVQKGVAAVRYKWWLYMNATHTVYVPGYGSAVISDVGGGAPEGNFYWIDLGYSDDDWIPWYGWVTVYFTTPIPPPEDILYILPQQ